MKNGLEKLISVALGVLGNYSTYLILKSKLNFSLHLSWLLNVRIVGKIKFITCAKNRLKSFANC